MKHKTKVKFIIGVGYLALFCLSYNVCGWFFQSDVWNEYRDRQLAQEAEQTEQKEEVQEVKDITITLPAEEQQGSVIIYQRDETTGEVYQESYTGTIKEQNIEGTRNISIYTY